MNSGMGGMSIFSICRCISLVASHDMPGTAPSQVGRCMPGLPTVATLIAGAVRHDQPRVDPFERALRDHDRLRTRAPPGRVVLADSADPLRPRAPNARGTR